MLKKIITPINFLMKKSLHDSGKIWEYLGQYFIACGVLANFAMVFLIIMSLI